MFNQIHQHHFSLIQHWIQNIDQASGLLQEDTVQFTSSGGDFPRHFIFNKKGTLVFVANQKSNNVVVFARNTVTGPLKYMQSVDNIAIPTFVLLDE